MLNLSQRTLLHNMNTNRARSSNPHPITMKWQLMKLSISLQIWKAKGLLFCLDHDTNRQTSLILIYLASF